MRLLVFGFGYSAEAVVRRLRPRLAEVWGTTRQPEKLPALATAGVVPIVFDGTATLTRLPPRETPEDPRAALERETPLSEAMGRAIASADHVLVCIPPGEADPVLSSFRDAIAAAGPRSIVYLSTVGVYGDHGGAWVDEDTPCRPGTQRSIQRLRAEVAWGSFAAATGIPVTLLRLAGIYGPGRGPFEKIRQGRARRIVKPGQVFNRIHVDDIAAVVEAALEQRRGSVFNGADDEPAAPEVVLAHAAGLIGLPLPPEVSFETAEMTPMARSFYAENKRVANRKIREDLGVRLRYPTYREGLAAILAAENLTPVRRP